MKVLDFYEVPKPCVVMPLIEGYDLRDLLDQRGRLNATDSLSVLRGIGNGLKHLHEHGVVHRDMKSPNVLIELPSFRAVLIDLGIGKMTDSSQAQKTAGAKGTMFWMAPEMMTDNKWSIKYNDEVVSEGEIYSLKF